MAYQSKTSKGSLIHLTTMVPALPITISTCPKWNRRRIVGYRFDLYSPDSCRTIEISRAIRNRTWRGFSPVRDFPGTINRPIYGIVASLRYKSSGEIAVAFPLAARFLVDRSSRVLPRREREKRNSKTRNPIAGKRWRGVCLC